MKYDNKCSFQSLSFKPKWSCCDKPGSFALHVAEFLLIHFDWKQITGEGNCIVVGLIINCRSSLPCCDSQAGNKPTTVSGKPADCTCSYQALDKNNSCPHPHLFIDTQALYVDVPSTHFGFFLIQRHKGAKWVENKPLPQLFFYEGMKREEVGSAEKLQQEAGCSLLGGTKVRSFMYVSFITKMEPNSKSFPAMGLNSWDQQNQVCWMGSRRLEAKR